MDNDNTATEIEIEENDSMNQHNTMNIMSPSDDYTQQQNTVIKYTSNSMSREDQNDEVD